MKFIYAFICAGELDHAIKLSQPKLIFASIAIAPRALKMSRSNTFIKNVIFLDSGAKQSRKRFKSKFTISYSELMSSTEVSNSISSRRIIKLYIIL